MNWFNENQVSKVIFFRVRYTAKQNRQKLVLRKNLNFFLTLLFILPLSVTTTFTFLSKYQKRGCLRKSKHFNYPKKKKLKNSKN